MVDKEDFTRIAVSLERVTVGLENLAKSHDNSTKSIEKILDRHEKSHQDHEKQLGDNKHDITVLKTTNKVIYGFVSFLGLAGLGTFLKGIVNQ